ncbi:MULTISPECIES: hypothetical protein [unclassified Streptomyces]|uniref:hypothetical protein n=1 Tax=unclassified Streptomyces TaxID=2593676 RepID=UPI0006AE3327|nr:MULTISPECIES: hypothetical protein [unclassified Streptomyces]KOX19465.1 hypothetical protein ADL06_28935 [Streptomyces sp. NRRL F-6491]KOX48296.1 hypothetical protein ADL08_11050 [Streptomyces sp. NRRL F-6492]
MPVHRRAATVFALLATLQTVIGVVFTAAFDRAFGAPLFWTATGGFALAWYFQRKATVQQ